MTSLETNGFRLEDWQIIPAEGTLARGDEIVRLEPKAMEVLVYFASRPGEVITREELERDVWRGALVGYDAVTNTVIKLRKALGDDARHPRFISTIPKKGYQLKCPVSLNEKAGSADITSPSGRSSSKSHTGSFFTRLNPKLTGIAVVVVLVIAAVAFLVFPVVKDRSGPPSIIVLPFENLNADPKQDFLADGITEDITTDLSKLSNIHVIASNTSSAYKGKNASIMDIGKELNVSYALKGTIRRLRNDFRVNVQLVNTETGYNAWASRYDRNVNDLFAIQDDMTRNIVRVLAIKMSGAEQSRLEKKPTDSLKAYDYFQEGLRHYRAITKETNVLARQAYRKAIELDPNYGRAYGAIAVTLVVDYRWGWTDTPQEHLDRALELAKKAVELDHDSPQTYWALGFVHLARKEYEEALASAEKSIEVAPNYADGYGLLGIISSNMGEAHKAIEYTRRGMRLNPYYTWEYLFTLGQSYYTLEEYDKAIKVLENAQSRNPNAPNVKLFLAACYVRVGRQDDAEWVIEQLEVISPATTLSGIDKTLTFSSTATKKLVLADLKQAGLPD
jgi:adenylate cyclase